MLDTIDRLCDERDRLKKEQPGPIKGKALGDGAGDMRERPKWCNHNNADNPRRG
jgi:hypothetical protein